MGVPLLRAEVDLGAIDHNIRALKAKTADGTRMLAAVKANAYGHGMVPVANRALASGIDWLGVARIGEGIALREAGITAPVLVLGTTPPDFVDDLVHYDLTTSVSSLETAQAYSATAARNGIPVRIHIKVDSGMGRLGLLSDCFRSEEARPVLEEVMTIMDLPGVSVEGILSHFALADATDKTSANGQFAAFATLLQRLDEAGRKIPLRHMANSAGAIDIPESHLDMVRPGISVYGLNPSDEVGPGLIDLQPAMTIKARMVNLKQVGAGLTQILHRDL
jgi:alanine racemase